MSSVMFHMNKQVPWIMFSGGGTMGSVSPLLSLWEYFHEKAFHHRYVWIGTRKGVERDVVEKLGMKYEAIFSGKLRRYISLQNLIDPFFILIGFFQSLHYLLKYQPKVVITSGGFVSVPLAYAAFFLNIPVHVHQQDLKIGLANKLMIPFAKSVSVALPELMTQIKHKQVIYTGNPIRMAFHKRIFAKDAIAYLGFDLNPEKPVLLVVGGGTGALTLNALILDELDYWLKFYNIIHITGKGKQIKKRKRKGYLQAEFFDAFQLSYAYHLADIVISRAGMSTCMELCALQKISVIIAIPDSHQEENATYFKRKKSVLIVSQKRLTPKKLFQKVKELDENLELKMTFTKNMKQINQLNASVEMARVINQYIS